MSDQPKEPENHDRKGKVIALNEFPKKKRLRPSGEGGAAKKKIPKSDVDKLISGAMQNDKRLALNMPVFERNFAVTLRDPGVRVPVEILDGAVVRTITEGEVTAAIVRYTRDQLEGKEGFDLRQKDCEGVMRYWRDSSDILTEVPAPVRWQGEAGLCYRRLPWLYTPDAPDEATPTWNEFLSRTSNSSALIEWIGSLFIGDSDRSQYVYLYGQGADGKSSLLECLRQAFGPCYQATEPPARDDRHWAASLINARIVAFPDCGDPKFVASGRFKQMDGGVKIDQKYEKAYTEKLNCKFIFASNERPQLSSGRADMRRVIYCEFSPRSGPNDPNYQAKLLSESGAFFSRCVRSYLEAYPHRGEIKTNNEPLLQYTENVVEGEFEAIIEEWFRLGPNEYVVSSTFNAWKREFFHDRRELYAFIRYLERRGISFATSDRRSVKTKEGPRKAFWGLSFKKYS